MQNILGGADFPDKAPILLVAGCCKTSSGDKAGFTSLGRVQVGGFAHRAVCQIVTAIHT